MSDAEKFMQFIQAHLEMEQIITALIESNLAAPDLLQINELKFAQKARLMAAMGLASKWTLTPVLAANGVRNRIVHRPNHEITKADEIAVLKAIPAALRKSTDSLKGYESQFNQAEPTKAPDMRVLMSFVCGFLASSIDVFKIVREHDRSMLEHMKKAFSNTTTYPPKRAIKKTAKKGK